VRGPRWPESIDPACFLAHTDVTPDCVVETADPGEGRFRIVMGAYSPWYFLIEGVPTLFVTGKPAVYVMRLMSAALCAGLLASALLSAQRLGRWAVVGVAFGITPMALYLGGAMNPNGPEIASAIAIWASAAALALAPRVDERLLARTAIAFAICVNTRGLSLPMAFVAIVLALLLADRGRVREVRALPRFGLWCGVAAGGVAVAVAWSALMGVKDDVLPDVPFTYFDGLERTPKLFREAIATFGWSEVKMPGVALIWFVALVAIVLLALARGRIRDIVILVAAGVASVSFPTVVSMIQPPPIHAAWYGRYGLPLTVGVPILAGAIAATRRPERWPRAGRIVPVLLVGLVVAQVWAFAGAARRYMVGEDGPLLYLGDPAWTPPLPAVLLLVVLVAAVAGYAWFVGTAPVERADVGPGAAPGGAAEPVAART
jgi:hypothetical protein